MTTNLELDKNPQLLFVKERLASTTKFAYCACWHGELADEDEHDYESTCLAMHHLTVVEEESVETLTVQNDQDDATSTTNVENSSDFKRKILRWNFPTFGDIYIFLKTSLIKLTATNSRKFVKKNQALLAFGLKESFFHTISKIIQLFLLSVWVETLNQAETLNEASRSKTFQ